MKKSTDRMFAETTTVSVEKSAGEIQGLLGKAGATAIMTEYEDGEPIGIAFRIELNGQIISFLMPCRWREIRKKLKPKAYSYGPQEDARAKRIAWRHLYWWIKAQVAMIETAQVQLAEVFLPYAQYATGETVYERLSNSGLKALTYDGAND